MNTAKGHLFVRDRVGYRFRALVDRTLRERRHEERRLAEQRGDEASVPGEKFVYSGWAKLSFRPTVASISQSAI